MVTIRIRAISLLLICVALVALILGMGVCTMRAERTAQEAQNEATRANERYKSAMDSLKYQMEIDSLKLESYRTANQRIIQNIDQIKKHNAKRITELFTLPVDSLLDRWAAFEHRLDSAISARQR